jgi:2-polyprenyl-3-methyl-5-hydroxy-6-metoxy-1,4-benzoquinol methylase
MINTAKFGEKLLQNYRFKIARPYLTGSVLDFGGNKGELKAFVKGEYTLADYDHSPMEGKMFDTIVLLAVIEHIHMKEVFELFHKFKTHLNPNGKIFLTTPTPMSKPVLEVLSRIGVIGRTNIEEHKHYWNKGEINRLAYANGFSMTKYRLFQLGFNQVAIFEHKK